MEQEAQPVMFTRKPEVGKRVAIIGAGPAGIAAAQELAYAGFGVTVFEHHPYPAGMVGGAIPTYRIPQKDIDQDMAMVITLSYQTQLDAPDLIAIPCADNKATFDQTCDTTIGP